MSTKLPTVWTAEPHTVVKIEILKNYLHAWFRILAMSRRDQVILYVDGFAGPGHYKNHTEGSPLAAIGAAKAAIASLGGGFIAKRLHCAFIEADADRFKLMAEAVSPFEGAAHLGISKYCGNFVDGIKQIKKEVPEPFSGKGPLLIFADPFGGTDTPFETMANCIKSDTAELLINLDADGIARIFLADTNANRDQQLTELFGNDCWKHRLSKGTDLKRLSLQILDLYKERLRSLPDVNFIWSFAMRGKHDTLNYHLVFATKHPLGLEKMKEAMRHIDKTGTYSFSDAHVGQASLFADNNTEIYAKRMFEVFCGARVSIENVSHFALNETPFLNAKQMLAILQKSGHVIVEPIPGVKLRLGTFPEEKIKSLLFQEPLKQEQQVELSL